MKITSKTYRDVLFRLDFAFGNVTVSETLSVFDNAKEKFMVPSDDSFELINAAHSMYEFNGKSDVDFAMTVINIFLDDTDKEELIKRLK